MEFSKLSFEPTVDLKLLPLPVPFVEVAFSEVQESKLVDHYCSGAPLPFGISPLFRSELVSGRRLTQGDDVKETLELQIDVKEPFSFLPGDSVGVFPQNPSDEVNELLKCLGLEDRSNALITITAREGVKKKLPLYVPQVSTPRIILESVLEIRGIVKKGFLRSLAEYTTKIEEKRRILELCCQEGSAEYNKYFLQQGLTLSDILTAMDSCVPPLSLLIEHLPRLMPRAYSIASSPLSRDNMIKIVFNVVTTPRGRLGVCSSWLKNKFLDGDDLSKKLEKMGLEDTSANTHTTIPLFFRKPSKFRIPPSIDAPLILIGPGTGIAPFIGFVEHISLQEKLVKDKVQYPVLVYFGCRYPDRDHIHKKEMDEFLNHRFTSSYRVCYSRGRLQESDAKYVQDLLYDDREQICDLVKNRSAYVFVCGDAANMAKNVQAMLVTILKECLGTTNDVAEQHISEMEKSGKFVKDIWR